METDGTTERTRLRGSRFCLHYFCRENRIIESAACEAESLVTLVLCRYTYEKVRVYNITYRTMEAYHSFELQYWPVTRVARPPAQSDAYRYTKAHAHARTGTTPHTPMVREYSAQRAALFVYYATTKQMKPWHILRCPSQTNDLRWW